MPNCVGLRPARRRSQDVRTRDQLASRGNGCKVLHVDGRDRLPQPTMPTPRLLHRSLVSTSSAATVAKARRANRATSFGLSCSATNCVDADLLQYAAPAPTSRARRGPGSAQPSSSSALPGRRDVLDVNRLDRGPHSASARRPDRRRRARSRRDRPATADPAPRSSRMSMIAPAIRGLGDIPSGGCASRTSGPRR